MPLDPLYLLPMASQTALRGRRVHDPIRECPQVYDEALHHSSLVRNEICRFNTAVINAGTLTIILTSLDQPATIPLYVARLRYGRIDGRLPSEMS